MVSSLAILSTLPRRIVLHRAFLIFPGTSKRVPTYTPLHRIVAHSNNCAPLSLGRAPNFVIADFINLGQPMQAVDVLNGF